ncbi:cell division protein FtsQ/DivIB [Roseovarius salinarum]|uniref:cell division protein FtsQ/DivIB n=1 Tax=Roseovarius salinarum TaxID=1981892 RepID=UPI002FCD993D
MTPRTDPAPSRLRYRLQRLMLTPLFRGLLRVGLPFGLCFAIAAGYLSQPERQEAMALALIDLRRQIETRPEFMVDLLAVEGASDPLAGEIREIFPHALPVSSFDLDLDRLRGMIEALPAVRHADLRIKQGGVLEAKVAERQPAALWRRAEGVALVDREGVVLDPAARRTAHPDLPMLAGEGADAAVAEALRLRQAAAPLRARLKGFVRVGERRWDVVLDRGQRILLPERAAVRALERVIALSQAQDMLARDVVAIDMRLADRPTVRMTPHALKEWRRVRKISLEAADG